MSAIELLPCPFCGGEASWISGGPGCAYVKCKGCPAETGDGSIPRIAAAWNRRTDLSQASVAAALEAAADEIGDLGDSLTYIPALGQGLSARAYEIATKLTALITPDQRTALQASIDAAKAEARAEDAAVLSKLIEATETARDYVSDASMGYVWHQDQSGSPLVKLDTKMPKDDIRAIDAALAAARDVEAALAQIGAKP